MSGSHDVSETSIIPGSEQSRAIAETSGVEGVDPSTDNGVLNCRISVRNLCTPMSDSDGYQMG
jgi:hypothetical protein